MTQEERDLLIKDFCERSPYGVKFRYKYIDNFFHEAYGTSTLTGVHPPYRIEHSTLTGNEYLNIEDDEIKPYLFPLSSMTDEQKEELITITDGKFRYMCGDITNAIPRDALTGLKTQELRSRSVPHLNCLLESIQMM